MFKQGLFSLRPLLTSLNQTNSQSDQEDPYQLQSRIEAIESDSQEYHSSREGHPELERQSSSVGVNTCRICFGPAEEKQLITPCLCNGSMKYVHESCLMQWLDASHRKKCELCQYVIQMHEEKVNLKQILSRTWAYLKEDKKRIVKIVVYIVYIWILKYRLFKLLKEYFKTLFKMNNAMKMLRILYNAFICMLVLQLAVEEYGRIKAIIQFFKKISVSIRIKNREETQSSNSVVGRIMLR